MHGLPKNRRAVICRGFTLVELLVVVGVITLLVSILLPALTKAMGVARTIKCLSNLRQQGMVVSMYAADNAGRLPWNEINLTAGASFTQWVGAPYAGLNAEGRFSAGANITEYRSNGAQISPGGPVLAPQELVCPEGMYGYTDNYTGTAIRGYTAGRFRTPTTTLQILSTVGGDENSSVFSKLLYTYTCYTFNTMMGRGIFVGAPVIKGKTYSSAFANYTDNTTAETSDPAQRRITAVRYSSDTWMAWDGGTPHYWGLAAAVFRHPKLSCNFLYFDGHAETLKTTDVDGTISGSVGEVFDERALFDRW